MEKTLFIPAEWERHKSTWLSWPHKKSFRGPSYRDELDPIWVAMVKAIHTGEDVDILVNDEEEKKHVAGLLVSANIDLSKIRLHIVETDDVWIRDMGPIFVRDQSGKSVLTNWQFNGWGAKYPYEKDNKVSEAIQKFTGLDMVDIPFVLEGGAIEVNELGDFMAAETSIINDNRNPGKTKEDTEEVISRHFGSRNFIWISGINGADNHDEDTDFHIDGSARFVNNNTILCEYDPYYEDADYLLEAYEKHMGQIRATKRQDGGQYNVIPLPLTRKDVESAGCKGSYLNYYVCNDAVLVPVYNDENDALALKILEGFFPDRKVVGIDVCNLYPYGGMIHCVTQQQPLD